MLAAALVLTAFVLSGYVLRERREALEASFKKLSPAVPDLKAIEGAPYRGDVSEEAIDLPHSRKSIALLPATRRLKHLQSWASAIMAPLSAAILAILPIGLLGPWSALVGGAWGHLAANSLLDDDRRKLGATALLLLPLSFVSLWGAAGLLFVYAGARTVLDFKDEAAKEEAERERLADPRYLVMSTERRAARTGIGGGGGGDITAPTARDNSKA